MEFAPVASYVCIMIESKLLYGLKFSKIKNFSGLLDFPRESNFHDKNCRHALSVLCTVSHEFCVQWKDVNNYMNSKWRWACTEMLNQLFIDIMYP